MDSAVQIREALADDLSAIVKMLADDPLGRRREHYAQPLPAGYVNAFQAMDTDPNQLLIVATVAGDVAGVLQLTFIPNLTYQGSWRAQIEGVRVAAGHRSQGIGRMMFEWAIERARSQGCMLVQLTTDRQRPDALRFYASLGFKASHHGMKLPLR